MDRFKYRELSPTTLKMIRLSMLGVVLVTLLASYQMAGAVESTGVSSPFPPEPQIGKLKFLNSNQTECQRLWAGPTPEICVHPKKGLIVKGGGVVSQSPHSAVTSKNVAWGQQGVKKEVCRFQVYGQEVGKQYSPGTVKTIVEFNCTYTNISK